MQALARGRIFGKGWRDGDSRQLACIGCVMDEFASVGELNLAIAIAIAVVLAVHQQRPLDELCQCSVDVPRRDHPLVK